MKRVVLFGFCFLLGLFTACAGGDAPFAQKNYTIHAAQAAALCIEALDRSIEVALSADSQIHIAYWESSKEYYDISLSEDGVLSIRTVHDKAWTDYIGRKAPAGSRKISLQVPQSLLTGLKLSTTNGDISLPALTVAGEVSLSARGGSIAFEGLDVGASLSVSAKNGDISGTLAGNLEDYTVACHIKKGKSSLPAAKAGGEKALYVSNNNGDIDIGFTGE